ncbi:hypothetical protein P4H71_08910 [Paenibacillus kribbensis]|uniref:hypothetical protein n=1 Tax=Paenibacillus kribbensis TaxID=172713 RepID=UPI002DBF8373|nr:hypothetical protein [Paenibacillus kribbensis]MEC0234444.1 hypothetical protein [Paenibacillus kribbensis]
MLLQQVLAVSRDETIITGTIGVLGSIIGGVFTLLGANWTVKKQEQEKIKKDLPVRLSNLFEISRIASRMAMLYSSFSMVAPGEHSKLEKIETEILDDYFTIYKLAAKTDRQIFESVSKLESEVKETVNSLSLARLKGSVDEQYFTISQEIKDKLLACSGFANKRRDELSQEFIRQ